MKYIDRFESLSAFLKSDLQQLTGDRIATIDGFELPILKKKLKTVVTVDPSTNEEVETEELQDVWMVPVGQEETKVEHNYTMRISYAVPTIDAPWIPISSFQNVYLEIGNYNGGDRYLFDSSFYAGISSTSFSNYSFYVTLFDNGIKVDDARYHFEYFDTHMNSWQYGEGTSVSTSYSTYATNANVSVRPSIVQSNYHRIEVGISYFPETAGTYSFNMFENLRIILDGEDYYLPDFTQNVIISSQGDSDLREDVSFNPGIKNTTYVTYQGIIDDPSAGDFTTHSYLIELPNNYGNAEMIFFNSDFGFHFKDEDIDSISMRGLYSAGGNKGSKNYYHSFDGEHTTNITLSNYSTSNPSYLRWSMSGLTQTDVTYTVTIPAVFVLIGVVDTGRRSAGKYGRVNELRSNGIPYIWQPNTLLYPINIKLTIKFGNGGASAATGLTFSASPQTATAEDISLGKTVLQGNALYNGVAVDWQQDLSINWTSGIAFLYRASGSSTDSWTFDPTPTGNVTAFNTSYKATWSGLTSGREYKMIIPFQYYDNGLQDGDFVILIDKPDHHYVLGTSSGISDLSGSVILDNETAGDSSAACRTFDLRLYETDGNGTTTGEYVVPSSVSVSVTTSPSNEGYNVETSGNTVEVYVGDQTTSSNNKDKTVEYTIEFSCANPDGGNDLTMTYTLTASWWDVIITSNVESGAYRNNTSITSVYIAEGVTSIGESAFNGCSNLTKISVPSTLSLYDVGIFMATGISSIHIPEGATRFNYAAFGSCSSLTSFTFPSTVTLVDNSAFVNSNNLTSITFEGTSPVDIKQNAFTGTSVLSVELPYGSTYVSNGSNLSFPSGCTVTYKSNPNA